MKIAISGKDFINKDTLGKKVEKGLKKPVFHLIEEFKKGTVVKLPFHYEYGFFSEKDSLIAIGEAKEVRKHFKKRVKGNCTIEKGKKIDKKKVAYGDIYMREGDIFVFEIHAGNIKEKDLKMAIKSSAFLKKNIKKHEIVNAPIVEEVEASGMAESTTEESVTAEQLTTNFQSFKTVEAAAFSKKKSSANATALIKKGKELSKKMDAFLSITPDAAIQKNKNAIDKSVKQVSAMIAKGRSKDNGSGDLGKIGTNIDSDIANLFSNYSDELATLGSDITDILKAVQNA